MVENKKMPEGWITRLSSSPHKYLNCVLNEGNEPTLNYFDNKEIFLPNEQESYESMALRKGDNILWLGCTGWTKPPKHYSEKYGVAPDNKLYESLVMAVVIDSIVELKKNGIEVDLRHGVSNAGVDAALINLMEKLGISGSGVNCPLYMPWVADDTRGGPIYVASSKEAYHDAYSNYHKLLIVTGGRDVAFNFDYIKRLRGDGYSVLADVMQTVSEKEILGMEIMPGQDKPQLNNAAAWIREKNSFTYSPIPRSFDELSTGVRLSVLYNASKILGIDADKSRLSKLEDEVVNLRKQPRRIVTSAELEERIANSQREFLNLKN